MFGRISSYRQRTFLATLSGPAGSRSLPLDFDYLVSDVVVVVKQSPVLIVFPVIASALITYSILERTISLIWLHRSAGVNAHCFSVRRDALAKFPFFIPRPVMLCQKCYRVPTSVAVFCRLPSSRCARARVIRKGWSLDRTGVEWIQREGFNSGYRNSGIFIVFNCSFICVCGDGKAGLEESCQWILCSVLFFSTGLAQEMRTVLAATWRLGVVCVNRRSGPAPSHPAPL